MFSPQNQINSTQLHLWISHEHWQMTLVFFFCVLVNFHRRHSFVTVNAFKTLKGSCERIYYQFYKLIVIKNIFSVQTLKSVWCRGIWPRMIHHNTNENLSGSEREKLPFCHYFWCVHLAAINRDQKCLSLQKHLLLKFAFNGHK